MGRRKKTIKSVFSQNTTPVEEPKQEIIPFTEPVVEKELVPEVEIPKEEELIEQPEKELVEQPLEDDVVEEEEVIEEPILRSFGELSNDELRFFDRTGILPQQ